MSSYLPNEKKRMARTVVVCLVLMCGSLRAESISNKTRAMPEMLVRTGHAGLIQAIGFSPDGKLVATWSFDGTLVVWNTDTLEEYTRFKVNTGGLPYFQLGDRSLLVSGNSGVFEYPLVRHPRRRSLVSAWVTHFVVSPDRKWLAHFDMDGSVRLLNLISHVESVAQAPREGEWSGVCLAFDGHSSRLAVSRPNGVVSIYVIGEAGVTSSSEIQVVGAPDSIGFETSGALWFSVSRFENESAKHFAFCYGTVAPAQKTAVNPQCDDVVTDFYITGAQFDSVSRALFVMGREQERGHLWSVSSRLPGGIKVITPPTPPNPPGFFSAPVPFAVSKGGHNFATADFSGQIVVTNLTTLKERVILGAEVDPVTRVEFSTSQPVMVVSRQNGPADIWDLAKGQQVEQISLGGTRGFAFARSHSWLAYFSRKRRLTLLDPLSGEVVEPGLTVDGSAGGLRVVDHDTKLIWIDDFFGQHPTLKMWDMNSRGEARTLCHLQSARAPLETSRSGNKFATVCFSGQYTPSREIVRRGVYVWTLPNLTPRLIDRQDVEVMTFSPDEEQLLLSGTESVDLETGAISEWAIPANWNNFMSRSVSSIAFSDDGTLVYVGNNFGVDRVEVWANWKGPLRSVRVVKKLSVPVTSLVSGKGGDIWVGSDNGTVVLVRNGLIALTLVSVVKAGWVGVTPDGLFDGNADAIKWIGWRRAMQEKLKPADAFFNSFYYPGLLADIAAGQNPVPQCQTIGDLLDLPGLDYLLSIHLASYGEQGGQFGLCLPGTPTSSLLDSVDFRYKGDVANVKFSTAIETEVPECHYFVPLPGDLRDYELNAKTNSCPQLDSDGKHDLSEAPQKGVTVHVQTITFNNYTVFDKLKFSASDGKAFRDFFATEAFVSEANGGPHVEVWRPLEDGSSLHEIRDRLAEIGRNTQPHDIVLLFLSGHGTVLPGQQMFFFLLDSIRGRDEDSIRSASLNSAMLADAIRNMNAERVLLVIDSCQSGGVLDSLKKVADVKSELRKRQNKAEAHDNPGTGVAVIAAATPFELAAEQDKVGCGFLLKALLDSLRTDSRDIQDLINNLKGHVDALTKPIHKQQSPEVLLSGDDFVLRTTGK